MTSLSSAFKMQKCDNNECDKEGVWMSVGRPQKKTYLCVAKGAPGLHQKCFASQDYRHSSDISTDEEMEPYMKFANSIRPDLALYTLANNVERAVAISIASGSGLFADVTASCPSLPAAFTATPAAALLAVYAAAPTSILPPAPMAKLAPAPAMNEFEVS
jgi:hypothetical protein